MPSKFYLSGSKPALQSKTIQGNIVSIVSTVVSTVMIVKTGAPLEIIVPAITAAAGAIFGNVMSIFGRRKATEKIKVKVKK